MKGVVVFDDKSDMVFFTLDKEMEKFVVDRITELEQAAGATVSLLLFTIILDQVCSDQPSHKLIKPV